MAKCPNCGGRVDLTKDGEYGHCADCNNIIEIKDLKEDSGQKETPAQESGGTTSTEVKK